jgi:hypothetical protein
MDGTFDLAQPATRAPQEHSGASPEITAGWVLVTAMSEELDERLFA